MKVRKGDIFLSKRDLQPTDTLVYIHIAAVDDDTHICGPQICFSRYKGIIYSMHADSALKIEDGIPLASVGDLAELLANLAAKEATAATAAPLPTVGDEVVDSHA